MDEDVAILESDASNNQLSLNHKNCILYRMGEKSVLKFYKECIKKMYSMVELTKE